MAGTSVKELRETVVLAIQESASVPRLFKKEGYDTLMIFCLAGAPKLGSLVVDFNESLILDDEDTLGSRGISDESEVSFFVRSKYEDFKKDPRLVYEN